MVGREHLLRLDLRQDQPAKVPAPVASRISNDLPFGLVQAFRRKRVVLGHTPQLAEQIVGIDIMRPSHGEGLDDIFRRIAVERLLDATELS